jgi:(p)ppGpp synthase/HD superfamily hydrolase
MTLYEKALKLASAAHKEQVRKHDGSPYIVHPIMVARILEHHSFSEEVVAAGLAHDVLEDTEMAAEQLSDELGERVARIVSAVSEDTDLEWEERKAKYVADVVAAGEDVWAVSLADKIHNAQNLTAWGAEVGADVWQNFNRGKKKKIWFEELVYSELCKVWEHPMLEEYRELIDEMKRIPA